MYKTQTVDARMFKICTNYGNPGNTPPTTVFKKESDWVLVFRIKRLAPPVPQIIFRQSL